MKPNPTFEPNMTNNPTFEVFENNKPNNLPKIANEAFTTYDFCYQ